MRYNKVLSLYYYKITTVGLNYLINALLFIPK